MIAKRIKRYRIGARGERGLVVTIPQIIAMDMGIKAGDKVSVYMTRIDDLRVLLLANSDKTELIDDTSGQARELAQAMGEAQA